MEVNEGIGIESKNESKSNEQIKSIIKQVGLFGIGVVSMTQERTENFINDMIKRGEIASKEQQSIFHDISKQKELIGDRINQKIIGIIETTGIATKKDFDILNKKIELLEKSIKSSSE